MTKDDLKSGMIIETRSGDLYMIQEFNNGLILINESGWANCNYDDKLKSKDSYCFDIMKIRFPNFQYMFIPKHWNEALIIWERKNNKQKEGCLLSALGDKWKWISKDKNDTVWVFEKKPNKTGNVWSNVLCDSLCLSDLNLNLAFDFISWDDDEPTNLDELRGLIEEDINEI